MAEAAREHPPLRDVHDFLDWVHGQEGRYEFVDGRIVAMAAGTRTHSALQMRLVFMLMGQLQRGPCRVHGSELLLRTDPRSDRRGRFADAIIECAPPDHNRMVEQPSVIFEILSADTEAVDRGAKLREYQAMPSLAHYVLIAQDARRVEIYSRQQDDAWLYRRLEGAEAVVRLDPPGVELPLAALYQDVM